LAISVDRDLAVDNLPARQAEVDGLARSVDLEAAWFESGHWISAELTDALAAKVLEFCGRTS